MGGAVFETKTLVVIEGEGMDSGRAQAGEDGASIRVAVMPMPYAWKRCFWIR